MDDAHSINAIGIIRTSFARHEGTPIQPSTAEGASGTIEVCEQYREALRDLDGFERIWLLYWFDRTKEFSPLVKPYRDTTERGLFSTRAPSRPNPLGISAVRLTSVDLDKGALSVEGIDVLDGTPLLDIKPYIPEFDAFPNSRAGWMDASASKESSADKRFTR